MFGTSWGGFNSIQMAVRQPPALKAFVALMATEALYQEDVHYMDGIICTDSWLFSNEMLNSLPGAPEFRLDEDWLRNRFEVEPSIFTYMRNQRNGAFWDRASSLDKYDKIKAAGFHIGGWYDGYRNSLPRMLENVKAPVKALIGPYDHGGPNVMYPGPNMEWRHEAVRWFDHWLKGIDTGIMDEPPFAVYVRDWHAPGDDLETAPGYWRWEDGWPIERIKTKTLYATPDHALSASPADQATHSHVYKPSMGVEGGGPVMWWGSLPPDQQKMDDDCLVYDSDPLEAPLEILGFPKALLNVSADASRANWIVRISDVAPDGTVTLFNVGSTAGLTTIEYEPGLVNHDIDAAFEKIAPANGLYQHEETWHDDNGHAHVRASLLGPSLTVPFADSDLTLGTWQQIVLIDFDTRPRTRKIACSFNGE